LKTHHFLILTLSIILLFCGDNKADRHKIVVAQIGSEEITLDDFEKSFLLNPQYATRTPVSLARTSQIHFLVQENYYYLAAKKIKLKEEKDLHKRLQYIRDQEILKAFINEEFLSKINISSANILDGLNKLNKEIRIINYFTADLESAIKLREILTVHNEEFYTKRNLTDNEKDKSTGTDLGWITFGMLDQSIEKAAYNLKEGDISKPVKSEYGYHIIKILKIRQNNDIQNMNLDLKKNRVETILKKRIAHLQIRDYITGLTQNEKIQINNRGLDFLISEIHKNVQPAYLDQNFIKPPIHNQELINIELKLSEKINNPLIRFGDTELTISNLLERLKEMPPFHRPYLGTRDPG